MEAHIGLRQENAAAVCQLLQKVLADEFVLYAKTRKAHWCVTGASFLTLHKYYEELYIQLEEFIDEVAERIRLLGHYPVASLAEYVSLTSLAENAGLENNNFILELLHDHETIIQHLRKHIEIITVKFADAGSADFVTQLMVKHEKTAWMLRSLLDK